MESTSAQERFTRLLIEHEPELLRCILVAVPNRPDARDILQDCSVSLWRKFDTFDPNKPFVPWALGFVRIEIRRFLREASRQAKLSEQAVESLLAQRTASASRLTKRRAHLAECIEALSERHRMLVDEYYLKDYSVAEIAKENQQTADSIYKRLQRIRQNLHDCVSRKIAGART